MEESNYDEAQNARQIAQHLGTNHTEFYLNPLEMAEAVPSILDLLDEPFADSSLIPTYFVSKLTRQKVKVSLSGDGGDELFCGYTRYKWSRQLWNVMKWIPMPLKKTASHLILSSSRASWDQRYSFFKCCLPDQYKEAHFGQKLYNLEKTLQAKTSFDIYERLVSHVSDLDEHLVTHVPCDSLPSLSPHWNDINTLEEKMMLTDLMHYLPNDILSKVDRASMMVGLEARVPFLTPEMVEFAWSLPLSLKLNKSLLKQVLYEYVPCELVDRPKMGFGIAIGQWLRGPLRSWANDLLDPHKLKIQGLVDVDKLVEMWQRHLNQQQNHEYLLWNHLVFQHWYRKNFS
jgi:asparagine synthase (glutamine-hydrolysing)